MLGANNPHNIELVDAPCDNPYWLQSPSLQWPDDRLEEEEPQHMNQTMNHKEWKEETEGGRVLTSDSLLGDDRNGVAGSSWDCSRFYS